MTSSSSLGARFLIVVFASIIIMSAIPVKTTAAPGDPYGSTVTAREIWFTAKPTNVIQTNITIKNIEGRADTFDILVIPQSGGLVWEVDAPLNTGYLPHDAEFKFPLNVTVPPITQIGSYDINVEAWPHNNASGEFSAASVTLHVNVTSAPVLSVTGNLAFRRVDPGRAGNFTVTVSNNGNVGATAHLVLYILNKNYPYNPQIGSGIYEHQFASQNVTVSPGSTGSTDLMITVPHNIYITNQDFWVRAYPVGNPDNMTDPLRIGVIINNVPYLTVTNISFSPEFPLTGKTITLTATIKNSGAIDATNVPVIFYDIVKGRDVKIGEGNVTVDDGYEADVSIEYEFTDSGEHDIKVVVMPNATAEPLEAFSNHTSIKLRTNPELVVFISFIGLMIFLGIVTGLALYEKVSLGGAYIPPMGELDRDKKEGEDTGSAKDAPPQKPEHKDIEDIAPVQMKRVATTVKKPKIEGIEPVEEVETAESRRAEEALHTAEKELEDARDQGIDVLIIEKMLREAKEDFKNREFEKAVNGSRYVKERVESLMAKQKEATEAIREAKSILSSLKWEDVDLSTPRNFVTRAETALKNGEYVSAITYAKKAKNRALQIEKLSK